MLQMLNSTSSWRYRRANVCKLLVPFRKAWKSFQPWHRTICPTLRGLPRRVSRKLQVIFSFCQFAKCVFYTFGWTDTLQRSKIEPWRRLNSQYCHSLQIRHAGVLHRNVPMSHQWCVKLLQDLTVWSMPREEGEQGWSIAKQLKLSVIWWQSWFQFQIQTLLCLCVLKMVHSLLMCWNNLYSSNLIFIPFSGTLSLLSSAAMTGITSAKTYIVCIKKET